MSDLQPEPFTEVIILETLLLLEMTRQSLQISNSTLHCRGVEHLTLCNNAVCSQSFAVPGAIEPLSVLYNIAEQNILIL